MGKAYRARADVSIPKPVSPLDPSNPDGDYVTEGVTYPAGMLIPEEWLTPRDRKRAENGDLDHLLQSTDEEVDDGYVTGANFAGPERGVFIAEHEAEATALESGGHIVIPDQQKMELLSQSADHAAQYQQAAREHGLDRRPVLDHLQSERPRVPNEMLRGGETPSGVPHNRGPEQPVNAEQADSDNDDNSEGEASRPAPGSSSQQTADPQTVGTGD